MSQRRGGSGIPRPKKGRGSFVTSTPPLAHNPNPPTGSSTPVTPISFESDDTGTSKKRRWTSKVWDHYNVKDGECFQDRLLVH